LGASPDGIASRFTLTNEFSEMVGTMLEIKCPYSRTIKTEGKIDGEICPHYYHCQVQQQLECCDLPYCDFWQCNLKEYDDRSEWLDDICDEKYTEEQNEDVYIHENCRKGAIIQLLPKKRILEDCEFDAKFIYPNDINMSLEQYDKWLVDEISNLHINHERLMNQFVFDKILYWRLNSSHNVKIKRDQVWFKEKKPIFEELWNKITDLRANPKEAIKFRDDIKERKAAKSKKRMEALFVKNKNSPKGGGDELFVDSDD